MLNQSRTNSDQTSISRRRLLTFVGAAAVATVAGATAGQHWLTSDSLNPVRSAEAAEVTFAGGTLDPAEAGSMAEALDDEYKARATYEAVIAKFGKIRPFTNIVRAEESHIRALLALFDRYEVTPPADVHRGNIVAPSTVKESCQLGVQAEIDNGALYDRLFASVNQADVVRVFTRLRDASLDQHLPAFQRFA